LTVAEVGDLARTQHACSLRLLHASSLQGIVSIRDPLLVGNGLLRLETQGVLADRVIEFRIPFLVVRFLLSLTDEDGWMRLVLRLRWWELWLGAFRERVDTLVKVLGPERILVNLGLSKCWVFVFFLYCVGVIVDKTRTSNSPVDSIHRVLECLHLLVVGLDNGVHVTLACAYVQSPPSWGWVVLKTPLNAIDWYIRWLSRAWRRVRRP
jgi:hypothetical protein